MGLTKVGVKGLDDGTDGQIITYDANGNPVTVGPGTDGQVLTSTGAGSPPAFEDIPAAGAALTGSTNNTITTVTGANAIQGEANLTFDGNHLTQTIDASAEGIKLVAAGAHYPAIELDANRTSENHAVAWFGGKWNGTSIAGIAVECGDDTTNKDDGKISFYTTAGGTQTKKMAIEQDGNVHIENGNLVIGTSGQGIDFSATSDGGTTTPSELLDDYEEGTFDGKFVTNSGTFPTQTVVGHYVKVGKQVTVHCQIAFSGSSGSGSGIAWIELPFTCVNARGGMAVGLVSGPTWSSGHQIFLIPEISSQACYLIEVQPDSAGHTHLGPGNFPLGASNLFSYGGSYITS